MKDGNHYPWIINTDRGMSGADGKTVFKSDGLLYAHVYFCKTEDGYVIRPTGNKTRGIVAFCLYIGEIDECCMDRKSFIDHTAYDGRLSEDEYYNNYDEKS